MKLKKSIDRTRPMREASATPPDQCKYDNKIHTYRAFKAQGKHNGEVRQAARTLHVEKNNKSALNSKNSIKRKIPKLVKTNMYLCGFSSISMPNL